MLSAMNYYEKEENIDHSFETRDVLAVSQMFTQRTVFIHMGQIILLTSLFRYLLILRTGSRFTARVLSHFSSQLRTFWLRQELKESECNVRLST